jgi:hypothetical protein
MKVVLICPGRREAVAALMEREPLVNVQLLGKSLLEYWLEHLVEKGADTVQILAADRPEQVRALVGDGARWGLHVSVHPERRELSTDEARAKYREQSDETWLPEPLDAIVLDRFPGLPAPLFNSYADWFAALAEWMPRAATSARIGVREIRPGIWAGLGARISPTAELHAPCWVGEDVRIGPRAIVGPMAIVEARALIESDAEVVESMVGPETLLGRCTELRHSLAVNSVLVNWRLNSCVRVRDAFLLSGLEKDFWKSGNVLGRVAALFAFIGLAPFALGAALRHKRRARSLWRALLAARPRPVAATLMPGDALVYYELRDVHGVLRRWPQLWNIVRGEFAWVGNRPLSPQQAERLANDYERLWLAAPIGLISLADAEGCRGFLSDEARAHASYYAAQAGGRLNRLVLLRTLFLLAFGLAWSRAVEMVTPFLHRLRTAQQRGHRL